MPVEIREFTLEDVEAAAVAAIGGLGAVWGWREDGKEVRVLCRLMRVVVRMAALAGAGLAGSGVPGRDEGR
jgi:hypothetical protein